MGNYSYIQLLNDEHSKTCINHPKLLAGTFNSASTLCWRMARMVFTASSIQRRLAWVSTKVFLIKFNGLIEGIALNISARIASQI